MKASEIRQWSNDEIIKKIKDGKAELLDLRMQNARGSLEKPDKIKAMRKDIARMMTVLNERKETVGGKDNE